MNDHFQKHLMLVFFVMLLFQSNLSNAQQTLQWPDGTSFTTFGANEAITIDLGIIEFIRNCPGGIEDFIFPFADVYVILIIPGGSVALGDSLIDVNNFPNTVQASSGGAFVSEIIGITKPSGNIGNGLYAVIFDECQNEIFDAEDAQFAPAFKVTLPAQIPPIDPVGFKSSHRIFSHRETGAP